MLAFFVVVGFGDRVSLFCRSDWPGTKPVVGLGLELSRGLLVSASQAYNNVNYY